MDKYTAKVVTRHGAHLVVKDQLNRRHICISTKKFSHIVCGDRVVCAHIKHDRDQILDNLPRKNELVRQTDNTLKVVASNIDILVIVCAVEPVPSLELIDHYIVAAELLPARAIIVVNKTDLPNAKVIINTLHTKYKNLPYSIIETNKVTTSHLDSLTALLKNNTCIFVGQSGVGKSTIINTLIPNLDIETRAVSNQIAQGRHTTSTTTLYDFPRGGELIDSPGVRAFSLPKLEANNITNGFIEIDALRNQCKFHDCKHLSEPQCAVKQAVEKKEINMDRYISYKNMITTASYQ